MRKVAFVLTVEFSDDLRKDQVMEVARNIVGSLVHTINNGSGLVPDDAEAFTTNITIDSASHNLKIEKSIKLV